MLRSAVALLMAAIPLGEIRAFEARLTPAAAHAPGCRADGAAVAPVFERRADSRDGGQLVQACPSPRCPAGRVPCAYQIQPNGCLSWRCCVPR
jgi:hypothetical protein